MDRRDFLVATAVAGFSAAHADPAPADSSTPAGTDTPELSLDEIAAGFKSGKLSSQRLTQMYLDRIERLDRHGPMLGAVI
jgi:amidase